MQQLRQVLNYEGSFLDTIAQLARDLFTLTGPLFKGQPVLFNIADADDTNSDDTYGDYEEELCADDSDDADAPPVPRCSDNCRSFDK